MRSSTPGTLRAARPTESDLTSAVDAVRRLVRGLRLAEQRTRSVTGLSAAQHFVLSALQESTGSSLGELAERTLTDRTSVSAVVERLESDGAVRTGRDPADRRRTLVHITAAGRRRLDRAPAPPTVQLLTALRRLTPEQLRRLTFSLGDLLGAMGLRDEPPTMLFEATAEMKRGTTRAGARARRTR